MNDFCREKLFAVTDFKDKNSYGHKNLIISYSGRFFVNFMITDNYNLRRPMLNSIDNIY